MLKRIFLLSLVAGSPCLLWAQEDVPSQEMDTIQLSSLEVVADLPITSEKISENQIESKNLGQDMPILLKNATAVVSTSDAGNGVGYTAMRIRGIKQNQINVTFNGVPVNDSESHGVYWVDFPDVSSSTEGITIQRGVGTSSNGATSFGGSVNVKTDDRNKESFAEAMLAYGSFNTQKYMLSGGTGDFANGKLNIDARQSVVKSDGFIDRASSDLYSTAINARYMPNKDTEVHLMNIFGYEKTYQAWYGIGASDLEDASRGRTYNPAGAIYNSNYEIIGYYDNEIDNYTQNHTHLYWKQNYANNWKSKATLHYTRGIGYFESYDPWLSSKADLSLYGVDTSTLTAMNDTDKPGVIGRRWLDNHFYGGIFNIENTRLDDTKLFAGIAVNKYIGKHYGNVKDIEIIDGQTHTPVEGFINDSPFYQNESNKIELSSFVKVLHQIENIELFADLQSRYIAYRGKITGEGQDYWGAFKPFDMNYTFINPKAGINYKIDLNNKLYAAYGLSHREPTRNDIVESNATEPETLHDYEVGYRYQNKKLNIGINGYYMRYYNQLVYTGKLDNVGSALRENVGDSYRAGVELDAHAEIITNKLNAFGNFAWSQNKNLNYYEEIDGVQVEFGDTDISFSPDIVTSFGVDFTPIDALNISFVNKYVSSQYVTNTSNDALQLNDYFVSDLQARYGFAVGKSNLELNVLVNNIFDTEYINNGSGKIENGEPVMTYFPQAGRNILAGVKLKF